MEKGVTEKVSFLCILLANAIILGAVVPNAMNLNRYYNIRDPTYQEALQFTYSDQTDKNQYGQSYTCINFADDFVNKAMIAGYRCGYVTIEFPEINHAIVCFNTTDNGSIFIEPQNDELVTLATGQSYLGRTILGFSITWKYPIVSKFLFMLVLIIVTLLLFMIATLLAVIVYKRKHSF
jgi:hypothetical protein